MYFGTSNLTLDGKHRMAVPAKHRTRIKEACGGVMFVVPAIPYVDGGQIVDSGYLWLYTADEWFKVANKLMAMPETDPVYRHIKQLLMGNAEEVSIDSTGRLLLPARLRQIAGIEKNIALVGNGNKFEIKAEEMWSNSQDLSSNDLASDEDTIAELKKLVL